MALSDQGIVVLISTVGGVVTTYLTVKYKDRVVKKRQKAQSKDRMGSIFDGYERLIVQLTTDMDRKEASISRMEHVINELEQELAKTKTLLHETKLELHESQKQKREISDQLKEMRRQYTSTPSK